MPTFDDAAAMIETLPGVTIGTRWGNRTWFIGKTAVAWERPFSKADIKRFGTVSVPQGPILAVSVEDLAIKELVLSAGFRGVFTIEHFNNYPAVLIQLKVVGKRVLCDLIVDAWLAHAPEELVRAYQSATKRSAK